MSYEDLFERILQARNQGQAGQDESTNGVQGSSRPEGKPNGQGQGKGGVRKLRWTLVETAEETAIGERGSMTGGAFPAGALGPVAC